MQTYIVQNEFDKIIWEFDNFDKEIYWISKKFLAADYPQKFVESIIRSFGNDKTESVQDDYITPSGHFDIAKPVIVREFFFVLKMMFLQNNFCKNFITLQEVNLTHGLNG